MIVAFHLAGVEMQADTIVISNELYKEWFKKGWIISGEPDKAE